MRIKNRLYKFFDQGQRKFVKFAEALGVENLDSSHFEFESRGKKVLRVTTENDIKKGGEGSGIVGHKTIKDVDLKSYKTAEEFANKNAKLLKEMGLKSFDRAKRFFDFERFKDFNVNEMSREDSVSAIGKGIREGIHTAWFRNEDKGVKPKLYNAILNDDKVRSAGLNVMHSLYNILKDKDLSFKEFLNTEIFLYRGGKVTDDVFTSFSMDKNIAEKFAKQNKTGILEIKIKPKDTFGSYQTIAEAEVLVPKFVLEGGNNV